MKDESLTFILFGATGDLARGKIIPALFELYEGRMLPSKWRAVFFIRKTWHDGDLRQFVTKAVRAFRNNARDDHIQEFASHITLFKGDLNDPMSYEWLRESLNNHGRDRKVFYLALSPSYFHMVVENIRKAGITDDKSSLLIEKPFGRSLNEAKELNKLLHSFLSPDQICRVDHYLGKDGMKEISNIPTSPIIKSIEVRIIEASTIENRGAFYDSAGAFVDVGQNHLLIVASTILCRTLPLGSRLDALKSISIGLEVMRGQYGGYRREMNVKHDSNTETYFKIELKSNGVNCLLEGGKGFSRPVAEITIDYGAGEKVTLDLNKISEDLRPYSKVIAGALKGDSSLFITAEESEEEWRIAEEVESVLRKAPLRVYPKGIEYKQIMNNK